MSSACSDNLNKSVLSDTTELTASNYVFAAASRNKLEESMMEFKALQKMKVSSDEQNKANMEDNEVEEADTEDIQSLLQSKGGETSNSADIDTLVDLSNDGASDESLLHESIMSEDTNEMKSRNIRKEAAMEFEEGESFLSMASSTLKNNNSAIVDSNTQEGIESMNVDNQEVTKNEEVNVSFAQRHSSNTATVVSKVLDTSKEVSSNNLEDVNLSFRSSTNQTRLSSTPLIDLSFSASRRRRMSSQSMQRPESALKKHSQRIQSITESITKSRQYRESIKKCIAEPRHSLPPSTKFVGLSALEKLEQNTEMKHVDGDGLEATFKANNTTSAMDTTFEQDGDKINEILGDLNNDVNDSVDHVSPEKLNLSFDRNDSTVHERNELTRILKSPLLNREKTPNLPNAERVFNPLAASPGRNTRSQAKKRKSMGESNIFEALESSVKKVNKSATPKNKMSNQSDPKDSTESISEDSRDDTQNFLDFIVPKLDVKAPNEDSVDINVDSSHHEECIAPDQDTAAVQDTEAVMNDHQDYIEDDNEGLKTSQGSEEPTLLLSSGSTSSAKEKALCENSPSKSVLKRESSSTYRLLNSSVTSMTSSVARLSTVAESKSPFVPPTSTTKSKYLSVSSPLSGDEEDEEDIFSVKSTLSLRSINSPASAGSNEEVSAVSSTSANLEARFKEDDDIADTIDLQNIMADLGGHFYQGSSKKDKDKNRRSSSMFSLSTSSNTEDHSLTTRSLADTQDIQGLLNDETVRKPSLLPIQEIPTGPRHHYEEEHECEGRNASPNRESNFDVAITATPKSILKKKKSGTPKLNVAFCPPTAAEYNIGSPAAKFTPMCDMKTRERFQVPIDDKTSQNIVHSKKFDDTTFSSLESFHNEFSLSKDNSVDDETHTVVLENELGTMLDEVVTPKNAMNYSVKKNPFASNHVDYSAEDSESSILGETEDASHTIGLEAGLNEMLQKVDKTNRTCDEDLSSVEENSCSISLHISSLDHKIEGETIVLEDDLRGVLDITQGPSVERCENRSRHSVDLGQTDFEDTDSFSARYPMNKETQEDHTIPIESGLKDMLDNVNTSIDNTNTLSLPNASIMRPMEGDTIELDSDLRKFVGCIDESSMSKNGNSHINEDDTISLNDVSIVQQSHGDTVELEKDIHGLLQNSAPDHSFQISSSPGPTSAAIVDNNHMCIKGATFCGNDFTDQLNANNLDKKDSLDLIVSLEKATGHDSTKTEDTIELNSSPNLHRSQRRSSRRISLVPPSSDAKSSTGEYSDISALLKENISSIHSIHPKTPVLKEVVDIKWTELSTLFSRLQEDDLFSDAHDLLMQEAHTLVSGYNHSDMIAFLRDFFDNVCSELDDGADDTIDGDSLLSEFINIPTDVLLNIQKLIRGVSTHTAFNEFKNKLQLLESVSLEVVNNEFVKWETLVANALCSRIDEMKHDIDEDEIEIVRRLGLSDNIQESLNILSQHTMRKARLEEIRKKKVRGESS
jgi:hypothetical protein